MSIDKSLTGAGSGGGGYDPHCCKRGGSCACGGGVCGKSTSRATPPSSSTAEDDLLPLPEPRAIRAGHSFPKVYALAFTADQMRAYGQECARAALKGGGVGGHLELSKSAETRMDSGFSGGLLAVGAEDERAAFEAWFTSHFGDFARRDGDSYYSREIHNLWCAWRAALSANAADREAKDKDATRFEAFVTSILEAERGSSDSWSLRTILIIEQMMERKPKTLTEVREAIDAACAGLETDKEKN